MKGTYPHPLPAQLVTHVSAICGAAGDEWLAGIPRQVDELSELWSIDVAVPFAAGEFNFVAPAIRRNDGELAVLKIAPPYPDLEYLREAEFLRVRNGRGAVRLLEQDVERHAILIERAVPGENLAEIFADSKPEAIAPAITVLHKHLEARPAVIHVKTVDEWFDGLRRFPGTQFPDDYAKKALTIYERLSSAGSSYYLHGDFHPANVVNATREPYLAIDPKGVIGHVGYDIAVFLNNYYWWQETDPDIQPKLDNAVLQFSLAFDMDPLQIRQWAFAQMVLGAWWSFDEMPEHYDGAVAKADVWNV